MSVCLHFQHVYAGTCKARRYRQPAAGVTGGWELPVVAAGNSGKDSMSSEL